MVDVVDSATRSRMMSGIREKNTTPEIAVRSGLYARGLRYDLHRKDLPGKPDLAIKRCKTVVFVHGCFWHQHECRLFKWPKSNAEFWRKKIEGNCVRDQRDIALLLQLGWRVLIIWECAIKNQSPEKIKIMLDRAADWIRGQEGAGVQIEG
jgi:DNA mismatch endonuclease, patch repair protein